MVISPRLAYKIVRPKSPDGSATEGWAPSSAKEKQMSARLFSTIVLLLALISSPIPRANAQSEDRLRDTWKGPDLALIRSILKEGAPSTPAAGAAKPEVLKFTPAGDSGVADALAGALGRNETEKAALKQAFQQIKQGYEAEAAKEGKSNNLAAAMTFFIAANVAAYHQTDLPSDEAGEKLFRSLQGTMAGAPALARLSNAEKQQMHDWLVCMAGFVAAGYADAKQNGDTAGLKSLGELADYSMRLVLGVEVGKMRSAGNQLTVEGVTAPRPAAGAAGNSFVGIWSKSASSPAGTAGTATYAGYYKGQYHFKADGTYTFKAERRYASTSQGFWTTEESGTYSVNGDSLTISPSASRVTVRKLDGVIQKTQNNPLEKVTYKWRLYHFEGLNETQLVLQAARETTRDGGFSGNSNFPNSFLYSPGATLEWRY